ncbi:MAG: cation diffusion facilitator family transporter [Aminipila sp.]
MIDKLSLEKKILKISMAGSIIFMIAECIMAYITRSKSILMDCVFDAADLVMIGPFLLLIPLLYKPVTEERPYGFSQVESLFVIIKCSVLVVITVQLVGNSIGVIIRGGNSVNAVTVAVFELALSVCCIIMYLILKHYNKVFSSPSIKADLYMWKMDIIGSLGVGFAFIAQMLLKETNLSWAVPYIDPFVAIVMAIWLIIEPIKMVIEGIKNLVLFAPNEELMENIRSIAKQSLIKHPYEINFLDVIQTGRKAWVQIYVTNDSDLVSISELKKVSLEIKHELEHLCDQLYVEIIPVPLETAEDE